MTATDLAPARASGPVEVLRLHFAQRAMLLFTPPGIMLVVFVITAIITVVFWRNRTF